MRVKSIIYHSDIFYFILINGSNFIFSYLTIAIIQTKYEDIELVQYSTLILFSFIATLLDFGNANNLQNKGPRYFNKFGSKLSNNVFNYILIENTIYVIPILAIISLFVNKVIILSLIFGLTSQYIIIQQNISIINNKIQKFTIHYVLLNTIKILLLLFLEMNFVNIIYLWILSNSIHIILNISQLKTSCPDKNTRQIFNRWTFKYRIDQLILALLNITIWSTDRLILLLEKNSEKLVSYTLAFTAAGLISAIVQPFYKYYISHFRRIGKYNIADIIQFTTIIDCLLIFFIIIQFTFGELLFEIWLGHSNTELLNTYNILILIGFLISKTWFISGRHQLLNTTFTYNRMMVFSIVTSGLIAVYGVLNNQFWPFTIWLLYSTFINVWDFITLFKNKFISINYVLNILLFIALIPTILYHQKYLLIPIIGLLTFNSLSWLKKITLRY